MRILNWENNEHFWFSTICHKIYNLPCWPRQLHFVILSDDFLGSNTQQSLSIWINFWKQHYLETALLRSTQVFISDNCSFLISIPNISFNNRILILDRCEAILMALLLLQSTLVNAHLLTNGKRIPFTVYLWSSTLHSKQSWEM